MNLPNRDQRITEEEFTNLKSDEIIEAIVELGFQRIQDYRTNIRNAMSRILRDYVKIFELERPPSILKKILLVLTDFIFALMVYLFAVIYEGTVAEKEYMFGYEIRVFYIVLIWVFLIFLFVTARYSLKKF